MTASKKNQQAPKKVLQCLPWLAMLVLLTGIASCKGSRTATDSSDNLRKKTVATLSKKLGENELKPDWFRAKAKIKANDFSSKKTFNADIRMKKDSAIWVSVYPVAIKIEVGRALVTPDSVKVMDRFNKLYYAKGIDYLGNLIGYPLDFATLQAIVLGNSLQFAGGAGEVQHDKERNLYRLSGEYAGFDTETFLNPDGFAPVEMKLKDRAGYLSLDMQFDEYEKVSGKPFATQRQISVMPNLLEAELKFSKVEVDEPQKMPFEVNRRYKLVD